MSSKIIFTIFTFTSASTLHYIVSLFLSVVLCSSGCFQGPPLPNKPFITVWNTPTDRCEPEWNVSLDLSAFDIVVNKDQRWCGEYIVIFYDTQLGLYPYFDSNRKAFNGGVPQLGNLTAHLLKVEQDVANIIPDNEFQGIGVIDWEYWRPVFDRNWDKLSIYRNKSMELVKQRHPLWPDSLVEDIARVEFETAAQEFMEETLLLVQKLRPKSLWGFYGFPNCYNDKDADNCSQVTMKYNDQISWLFEWSSVLFPSIYLHDKAKLNGTLFVKYRLLESFRFAKKLDGSPIPVFPYVRITYAVSQVYLNVVSQLMFILSSIFI
ncbi:unnamed protein product [Porites evermanni]|uniref:Hyaluronidase n=1 Tax=Porites evermanni TaxID=104178 RepID=A0ABN8LU04_9CNID|nr:unnamed protein product [Porites evermanni]